MAGRRDRSPGGTLGHGTDSIQQHLSSWDRAVENICEEFADFGYMDDEDDDEVGDGIWREMATNNSGLHTLTPAPPRYSLRDPTAYNQDPNINCNSNSNTLTNQNVNRGRCNSNSNTLTNQNVNRGHSNTNPFSVNTNGNDHFDLVNRPIPAPRSGNRHSQNNSPQKQNNSPQKHIRKTLSADNSQIPLIDFSDDEMTSPTKQNLSQGIGSKGGPNLSHNFSKPGASNASASPNKVKDLTNVPQQPNEPVRFDLIGMNPAASNVSFGQTNVIDLSSNSSKQPNDAVRFDIVGTASASSLSSDLNSSAGSLAFSDITMEDQTPQNVPEHNRPPVRTVQSFDSNLDNLSAVERTLEKYSSWPANEAGK